MTTSLDSVFSKIQKEATEEKARARTRPLSRLVQSNQYVGEVFSLGYETALVQIHDFHRKNVGGIPGLSFLIATRIAPGDVIDYTEEDASVILLRVMDAAPLPNESEALRVRVETAQRVSGEATLHWDDQGSMDPATYNILSFAGIKCRVIGTFYLDVGTYQGANENLLLRFGSDISNYYPMKITFRLEKKSSIPCWLKIIRSTSRTFDRWSLSGPSKVIAQPQLDSIGEFWFIVRCSQERVSVCQLTWLLNPRSYSVKNFEQR